MQHFCYDEFNVSLNPLYNMAEIRVVRGGEIVDSFSHLRVVDVFLFLGYSSYKHHKTVYEYEYDECRDNGGQTRNDNI